jgi:PAS domain S-box-containing protein
MDRVRHLAVIAVNRAIANAVDQGEIMRLVVERAAALTGATACLLLLAGKDGLVRVVRSTGVHSVLAENLAFPLSEQLDAQLRSRLDLKAGDVFVGAPVIGEAGLRGILAIFREGSGEPESSDDEEVLSAFADQAAIALDNIEIRRALLRSEARFRTLASQAPIGIFEADSTGRYTYLNAVADELLGAKPGDSWQDSVHDEDRVRVQRAWSNALATGGVFDGEYRLHSPQGRVIVVHGHVAAVRDPDGKGLGHIGAIVDITERQFLRMQLALASRPTSIGMLAGSIPDVPGPTRIAAQLADYAGSAPGRIVVRLYDVVSQAIHWLPRAITETARIKVENLGEHEVSASPGQIEQVIVNLVTNAARATPPGDVGEVTVRIGPGTPGMARVEVIDRGVGIAPSAVGSIFRPFARVNGEGKRMGLGLAISHSIVATHAGTLTVMSALGQGSTFRMDLPTASPKARIHH